MEIWEKLLDLRKSHNLTQERLAQKLDISVNSIKNYEHFNKKRIPNIKEIKKYAEFFDVSYDFLLNDNVENKTSTNIQIKELLNLSDKAIDNLKNYNHSGINVLLEAEMFEKINNLLEIYIKFSHLSTISTQILYEKNNISRANKVLEIISIYKTYCENNKLIKKSIMETYLINEIYKSVNNNLKLYSEEDENDIINESLIKETFTIVNTFEKYAKMAKLELTEVFSEFLTTITD